MVFSVLNTYTLEIPQKHISGCVNSSFALFSIFRIVGVIWTEAAVIKRDGAVKTVTVDLVCYHSA